MKAHLERDGVTLYHGDCLDVLRELPDASVDAVVTDPPYGISFMGKAWDQPGEFGSTRKNGTPGPHRRGPGRGPARSDQVIGGDSLSAGTYDLSPTAMRNFQRWCEAWAAECLRVLKPGGHLLAFGGSRTWHRLAAGIEDAGFEIRDSIAWLYGSGFPKSLDVSKAIDKAAGAEREVVGRRTGRAGQPRTDIRGGAYNTAADGRIDLSAVTAPATPDAERWQGWGTALKPAFEPVVVARKPLAGTVAANVLAHGTGALNIDACRIEAEQTTRKTPPVPRASTDDWRIKPGTGMPGDGGRWPANVVLDETQAEALDEQSGELTSGANPTRRGSDKFRDAYGDFKGQEECTPARGANTGGASRFFYVAKADASERPRVDDVAHPTVKPLALMRWLVRLVTPPGGTVLEPFAGSGTTVEACLLERFQCVVIEREADYLPLIEARIARQRDPVRAIELAAEDMGLLGLIEEGA